MNKRFLISETEKQEILSIYESRGILMSEQTAYERYLDKQLSTPEGASKTIHTSFTIDDLIDMTSAAIDVIPGIGWAISAGIDVAHAISYIARFYKASTDDDKFKYAVSGIVTLVMSLIPGGGNVANIMINKGLNTTIKNFTPSIVKKMLGIPVGFNLMKSQWKYCVYTFLVKYLQTKTSALLIQAKEYSYKISNSNIPGLADNMVLLNFVKLINELLEISNEVKPNYDEINKHIK